MLFTNLSIRFLGTISLILLATGMSLAQNDLQKLVDTENAFARAAADKGTKSAFLEFLAADSIVFNPARANGIDFWKTRKESPSLLSWFPVYADVSGNGLIGYTTGPWEFRAKGKDDEPTAFGQYMTVWQKQPDGNFKAVLDIGISHDKLATGEVKLTTLPAPAKNAEVKSYAGDSAARFFELISSAGAEKAYRQFGSDDIRLLRDNKPPITGKKAALKELSADKSVLSIAKRMAFYGSDDIAYATNTYSRSEDGKKIETGNLVQVWKNRNGKWLIVMDVFVADPK